MANLNNIKLKLRYDLSANWYNTNPILLLGEMILVSCDYGIDIKIGDGITPFRDLPYAFSNRFETSAFVAKQIKSTNIAQGLNVVADPTSFATGIFTEASATFGVAHGIEAQIKEGDDYAFIWNGTNLPAINSRYITHGEGTFNINPVNGISGIYIGETTLAAILDNVKCVNSSDETNKISIAEDKTMEVNSLNTSRLSQTSNDELILFGGRA